MKFYPPEIIWFRRSKENEPHIQFEGKGSDTMASATSLILGESAQQRQAISEILQPTGLFAGHLEASSEREALLRIKHQEVAAICYAADHPAKSEFRWLRLFQKQSDLSDIPVFLFTEEDDEQTRILGLNSGADDCLTFSMSSGEAAARIRRHLLLRQNFLALRRAKDELARQAMTDPLTNLGNRRLFLQALEAEISRMNRTGEKFSLLMLDLDHFKKVNDSFGHQAGDAVLLALADILRGGLRKSDTLCRLGGEEFAVIMPGANLVDAARVAQRIRGKVAGVSIPSWPALSVTISIGIRCVKHSCPAETMIAQADQALYRAKCLGRNRVEVFSEKLFRPTGRSAADALNLLAAAGNA